jgi:hypothetical protein
MMKIVQPALNVQAVLAAIADIDGDGGAALDADALIALGLPVAFIAPLVENLAASELAETRDPVAGPATSMRAVWSLALLRALAKHYGLEMATPYLGHSRNAKILSDRIVKHLKGGA